jgi:hypothetical protein
MASRLSRDPERTPLLARRSGSRVPSAVGPTKEELGACEVFSTTLHIRALVIVSHPRYTFEGTANGFRNILVSHSMH